MKRIGLFIFCSFLSIYTGVALYTGSLVYQDTRIPSDAILVLGAASYKDREYNPCLVSRLRHAAELKNQGFAPVIIVSGGNDTHTGINESETMSKILTEAGIDAASIIREDKATSTYENIIFSKQIMYEHTIKNVILVTEPFHQPRAAMTARRAGLSYAVSPAADSPCWQKWKFLSRYFLREPMAIMYYKFTGRL